MRSILLVLCISGCGSIVLGDPLPDASNLGASVEGRDGGSLDSAAVTQVEANRVLDSDDANVTPIDAGASLPETAPETPQPPACPVGCVPCTWYPDPGVFECH
jgi:hypothetical protein